MRYNLSKYLISNKGNRFKKNVYIFKSSTERCVNEKKRQTR